ncbi:MAG: ribose 5-phosphate isomerase B [Lentimicrobiaceae bacterium]|jgi:ribose 5-phosphate isomerase B|nr:ribose 5-phosphate isomerase B [Lentimicrobiaceae bacterium]
MKKVIPIASDHGGFEMKEYIKNRLENEGFEIIDFGTFSNESVDYPDMIHPLAHAIATEQYELGIILCGSGNGVQMTANKHPNVRAALCWNIEIAKFAREHTNANVIALPGRFIPFDLAFEMVKIFLNTSFSGGRHELRVKKIGLF